MTDDKTTGVLTPAMKRVLIAVGAVVVVGVIAIVWFIAATAGGAGNAAAPGASTSNSQDGPSSGSSPFTPSPGATSGPLPEATPTTGSEVLPPTATPNDKLPSIAPQAPLVSAPLPASGTRSGGLVKGFPTKIMGPASKTTVISSSIASQGTAMQVTLVGTSTSSKKSIQDHYAKLWSSLGLRPGLTSDGSISYAGAHESVTLTFGSSGTGNHYTIYGVFRTK
jgi:hypothetical protein